MRGRDKETEMGGYEDVATRKSIVDVLSMGDG